MLFARGWTDGLPVVVPTARESRRHGGGLRAQRSGPVGPIPPRWRQATIEKIAINAVLAGCRPEYFPVVLAAIDALLDDDCQLYGIQTATNTTAPLLIVNGPIVQELDINARGNVFGQGARANATIGRAVQLVLRNIGGDIAGRDRHGDPWPGRQIQRLHRRSGRRQPVDAVPCRCRLRRGDSTVTVIGASAPQNIFTYGCETGQDILEHFIGATLGLGHNNIIFPTGPLFVVSPEHAATHGARRHRQEGNPECGVRTRADSAWRGLPNGA